MNKMYSPIVYFLARYLSNIIFLIMNPIIVLSIVIFGVSIDTDAENLALIYGSCLLMSLIGLTIGYLAGISCENDDQARDGVTLVFIFWNLTMGVFSNVDTNYFT